MKQTKLFLSIIAITFLTAASALADVRIKTRNTVAGQTTESTVYIKGKRQRSEQNFGGLKTVQLTQCDLRRDVQLNERAKTYFISLYEGEGGGGGSTTQIDKSVARNPASKIKTEKGGTVTTVVTLKDTGERKQMFGYTARRILTTMVTESSPDACSQTKMKMETDGWYIDAEFAFDCLLNRQYKAEPSSSDAGCQDRQIFKQNGAGKLGYPVYLKTTMPGENGNEDFTSIQEVLEISPAALDAALFEVPAGFREVKNRTEIFTGGGGMPGMNDSDDNENDGGEDDDEEKPKNPNPSRSVRQLAKGNTRSSAAGSGVPKTSVNSAAVASSDSSAIPATASPGAKRSGVVRMGLAAVKTGGVGDGMNAGELSAAVQNALGEYLKDTNLELVPIEARLPGQITAEAKQKSCDFVLYAIVSHKKGGAGGGSSGFGKMFGKIAPVIADAIPASTGSVEGNTAIGIGRGALYAAGAVAAANVKAKDELTLDIRVEVTDASVLRKQFKTKAGSDGEDIITPLVEQAAQAVVQLAANYKF